jgi:hypothetical protein
LSTTVRELLTFWPFTHQALDDDLRVAGLTPESTTITPDADRYLVTAIRRAQGPTRGVEPTTEVPWDSRARSRHRDLRQVANHRALANRFNNFGT